MHISNFLLKKIQISMSKSNIDFINKIQIIPSNKIEFGHYQIHGIIKIAKKINKNPITLAYKIIKNINLDKLINKIDIIEPGFANIFLNLKYIEKQLYKMLISNRLNVNKYNSKTIIIDYSSPNIMKDMHVGHIRSTIIGDTISKILEFLGNKIIRINHIGDWGLPIGIIIAYIKKKKLNKKINNTNFSIENLYINAKKKYDCNINFANLAHKCIVKLQNNDPYYLNIWNKLVTITLKNNQKIYSYLNISLNEKNIMGESSYKNMLPNIIKDLIFKKIATKKNKSIIVYLSKFKNKKGETSGIIIKKKDGAYLYTTIEIACIKYRCEILKADKIIYYVDSRQKQHLLQSWYIAKKAGYTNSVIFEHHSFGMVLDKNNKPFKTREGKFIKLIHLIKEAIYRAKKIILNKNPKININKLNSLAKTIGVGAIKYFDLSKNRNNNYIFDWNKILKFNGNTSLYIQYTYTRILSILKKIKIYKLNKNFIKLSSFYEKSLAIKLIQYEEIIIKSAENGFPHILCSYLYKVSALFSGFYENCSIIKSKCKLTYNSRIQIILLTSNIIKHGMYLLGINLVNKM